MKPYPTTLASCHGDCQQGNARPCKTEALCTLAAVMHRYPPPITKEGAATIEFEERRELPITMEEPDEPMTGLCRALLIAIATLAIGIVVLPFLIGAV